MDPVQLQNQGVAWFCHMVNRYQQIYDFQSFDLDPNVTFAGLQPL